MNHVRILVGWHGVGICTSYLYPMIIDILGQGEDFEYR